ncbi:hypothetical protein EYV94_25760 [Puteibacter caeruleilacunae]|nr:hypothetical protein EYV94_25760 [Puteibacter caeruleilacunae]
MRLNGMTLLLIIIFAGSIFYTSSFFIDHYNYPQNKILQVGVIIVLVRALFAKEYKISKRYIYVGIILISALESFYGLMWLKRSDHASKNGPNGATLKDGAIIGKKLFTHSSRHLFLETHL